MKSIIAAVICLLSALNVAKAGDMPVIELPNDPFDNMPADKNQDKWIHKYNILNDGSAGFGASMNMQNLRYNYYVDFLVESRLAKVVFNNGLQMKVLPFEIKIRINTNDQHKLDAPEAIVSAVAFLTQRQHGLPMAFHMMSYVLRSYEHSMSRFDVLEFMTLDLEKAFIINKNWLEIVIKGTGGVGAGFTGRNQTMKNREHHLRNSFDRDAQSGVFARLNGSLGVRIARRILVEFFSGVEAYSGEVGDKLSNSRFDRKNIFAYYGGRLAISITKWLDILASVQKEYHNFTLSSRNEVIFDRDDVISGSLYLRFNW